MAEGRTNAGIARRLWLTEKTIETHVRTILMKLGLPVSSDDHRRVLAVLTLPARISGLAPDRNPVVPRCAAGGRARSVGTMINTTHIHPIRPSSASPWRRCSRHRAVAVGRPGAPARPRRCGSSPSPCPSPTRPRTAPSPSGRPPARRRPATCSRSTRSTTPATTAPRQAPEGAATTCAASSTAAASPTASARRDRRLAAAVPWQRGDRRHRALPGARGKVLSNKEVEGGSDIVLKLRRKLRPRPGRWRPGLGHHGAVAG